MKIVLITLALWVGSSGFAKSLEGIEMAEKMSVGGKELSLNGMGVRYVQRFGLPIKVYVGGLYLEKTTKDSKALIANGELKFLKMVFLRSVDKKNLREAWKEGVAANCVKEECKEAKEKLTEFNKKMKNASYKGSLQIEFWPDKVVYTMDGSSDSKGEIQSAVFSKTLLAVFIGEKPPTAEFKKGLMSN